MNFWLLQKQKVRVKASLNEERNRLASQGRETLLRKFKNWKLELTDEAIRKLLKKYNLKLAVDFYYEVATGKIDPLDIKSVFTEKEEINTKSKIEELLPQKEVKELSFEGGDDFLIIDNNLNNVTYKLARCCNPVFGDSVYGFVTIKDGIKIHRNNCPNSKQMKERFPYRVVKVKWRDTTNRNSFLTTLYISGMDDTGVLNDVTQVIAKDIGTQMRSINIESDKGKFEGILKILVFNIDHLEFVINRLQKVKGITSVTRGDK